MKGLESGMSSSDQDWLKEFSDRSEQPAPASTPAWLPPEPEPQQLPAAPKQEDSMSDIPSWLKAAAPQSSIFDEASAEQEAPTPAAASSDTTDWLNTFKSVDEPAAQAMPVFSA
ncbi:MAG: hypothetical protein JZU63_02400, partial [Rhodoferax sp.]|nr:hypothetical protein [Rhodoferax sp.]